MRATHSKRFHALRPRRSRNPFGTPLINSDPDKTSRITRQSVPATARPVVGELIVRREINRIHFSRYLKLCEPARKQEGRMLIVEGLLHNQRRQLFSLVRLIDDVARMFPRPCSPSRSLSENIQFHRYTQSVKSRVTTFYKVPIARVSSSKSKAKDRFKVERRTI